MAQKIPPAPVGTLPGSSYWNDWYEKIRNLINSGTISQLWSSIDFTASNITDIVTRNHNNLQSFQGGTTGEYYHLTSAQHTDLTDAGDSTSHYHATDRARANHTGTQTMATISDLPTLTSGVYTPTLTNVTNVAASTAYQCQYMRVGSVVTVSGKVDIDATAAGAEELGVSLPIASNFGAVEDCGGVAAAATAGEDPMYIQADVANNRAAFKASKVDNSNHSHYFTFTYRVI